MRDIVSRVRAPSTGRPALAVFAVALLVLVAAWVLQARGYYPCELCLKERIPYEIGIPLAAVLGFAASRAPVPAVRAGYVLLGLVFAAGVVLGAYHAGVEWKFWAGPTECSGVAAGPTDVNDFLKQLQTATVVRCDEAALRVLGLSLAAWNAVISALLAALCAIGAMRAR